VEWAAVPVEQVESAEDPVSAVAERDLGLAEAVQGPGPDSVEPFSAMASCLVPYQRIRFTILEQ